MQNLIPDILVAQLRELAIACRQKNIRPIICGGCGVYLHLAGKTTEAQPIVRATTDIDVMFSRQDLLDELKRQAMAEIILKELKYAVQAEKKHHGFKKETGQELDILVPCVETLPRNNYRLTIVNSVLHGYITPEAEFIEEDLQTISLPAIGQGISDEAINVYVPCAANFMIMKLYAFRDRSEGPRRDPAQAIDHAFDVYALIMQTDRDDFREGQLFLSRHNDSDIIRQAKRIVEDSFSDAEKIGWEAVLGSSSFYREMSVRRRLEKLRQASARLTQWFHL
ncbi:MAG: nucleotidyl transferase AbiEii/AbiGii toxin family protein [Planctomycetaceae bacterium]|nr:nucleotidyl transferase AbiEii/AbiGii toxin family protein [Planctomycetaceae bacterium]